MILFLRLKIILKSKDEHNRSALILCCGVNRVSEKKEKKTLKHWPRALGPPSVRFHLKAGAGRRTPAETRPGCKARGFQIRAASLGLASHTHPLSSRLCLASALTSPS